MGCGAWEVSGFRVQDSELQVSGSELWVQTNGVGQELFDIGIGFGVWIFARLPESDRVIVVRVGIVRLERDEAVKFLADLRVEGVFDVLHASEEKIRGGVGGIQVGGLADALHGPRVGNS